MTDLLNSRTESNTPKLIMVAALLVFVAGIFITPSLLISLGPMRIALTSEIQSARDMAYFEVSLFRVCCILLSIFMIVTALKWKQILSSEFVRRVNNHIVLESGNYQTMMGARNRSFIVIVICIALGIIYIASGDLIFNDPQLKLINTEDGVIEYGSALFLTLSCIVSVILVFKWRGHKERMIMHSVFAFGFFAMAGEEISWGQRIFDLDTLEVIKDLNIQNENTLHNLLGYFADHLFIAVVFIYGTVMPYVAYINKFFHKFFDYIGIPIASLGLALGFLIITMMQSWTVYRIVEPLPHLRMPELRELYTAIAFSLLMYESWLLCKDRRSVNTGEEA